MLADDDSRRPCSRRRLAPVIDTALNALNRSSPRRGVASPRPHRQHGSGIGDRAAAAIGARRDDVRTGCRAARVTRELTVPALVTAVAARSDDWVVTNVAQRCGGSTWAISRLTMAFRSRVDRRGSAGAGRRRDVRGRRDRRPDPTAAPPEDCDRHAGGRVHGRERDSGAERAADPDTGTRMGRRRRTALTRSRPRIQYQRYRNSGRRAG
jgi:hypothetical protein